MCGPVAEIEDLQASKALATDPALLNVSRHVPHHTVLLFSRLPALSKSGSARISGRGKSRVADTFNRERRGFVVLTPCECMRVCSTRFAPNWRHSSTPIPEATGLQVDEVDRRWLGYMLLPVCMLVRIKDQVLRADSLSPLLATKAKE